MIYFIRAGHQIKIGFAINVAARLRTLQAGNAHRLIPLRTVDGGLGAEGWYHRHFANHRIDREWFHFHPDMLTITHPPEADRPKPGVDKLRAFLSERGKTPQDFADEIGVSRSAVLMWMRGERMPRVDALRKIASVTDGFVTANDFLIQEAA